MRIVRNEEGQAFIETAISLALLTVMTLGAVEFGRLTSAAIELDDAAKAAVQYGAQSPGTASNSAAMLTAAQNEYHTPAAVSFTTGTPSYVCTCADTGSAAVCSNNNVGSTSACPGSFKEVTITVQTQVTYVPTIHLPGVAGSFVLHGNAKQKVLQ